MAIALLIALLHLPVDSKLDCKVSELNRKEMVQITDCPIRTIENPIDPFFTGRVFRFEDIHGYQSE